MGTKTHRLVGFCVAVLCAAWWPGPTAAQRPSCQVIHGRANLFGGDGQLRIWHIGTHHEYQPDRATWPMVEKWLAEGAPPTENLIPASTVYLFGDFVICPTERYRKGAVQTAAVKSVTHRVYVPVK